jgi:hypothetical protein
MEFLPTGDAIEALRRAKTEVATVTGQRG